MDPWDIDIVVLSQRFMEFIKRTSRHELEVPAKIVLAAAILYRMKVDTLKVTDGEDAVSFEESQAESNDMSFGDLSPIDDMAPVDILIPPLSVPVRRYPKRKISMDELINALDKAMTVKNRREVRNIFYVNMESEDISERIEKIFDNILERIDLNNSITFSSFVTDSDVEDKIRTFSSILHLSNQERISCIQNDIFGEIYISVIDSKTPEGKQNA